LPINFSDEVSGGIGVGEAPSRHIDEVCAQIGLSSVGAYSKRSPTE